MKLDSYEDEHLPASELLKIVCFEKLLEDGNLKSTEETNLDLLKNINTTSGRNHFILQHFQDIAYEFSDWVWDFLEYFGEECNLPSTAHYSWSRNYDPETHAINAKGYWIMWTTMNGGGKHSDPRSYNPFDDAQFIELESEKIIQVVERKFKNKS